MKLRLVVMAVYVCLSVSSVAAVERTSQEGKWTFNDDLYFTSPFDPFDSASPLLNIPANIFIPASEDPAEKFPVIIFISSWVLNEHEYLDQAQILADQGYVVLSYTARGFQSSPGLITTAGETDVKDGQSAIDFLLDPNNHIPADPDRIAMGGVSYGAGIALLVTFQDERVKAVTALSGWGDLIESLWSGNTPNYTWLEILIGTSKPIPYVVKNRPDPIIEYYYGNMKSHANIEETKAWGYIRSPITYLGQVNARTSKPAVFMSNNMHDYLFQPDSAIRMLSQYEGPWRIELNRGVHASGEASGLLGNDENRVWVHVNQWLDHYLKDIDNGIDTRKPVNTIVLNSRNWESYDDFPVHDTTLTYFLNPVSGEQGGTLSPMSAVDGETLLSWDTTDKITYTGWVTGALNHTSRTLMMKDVDSRYGLLFNSATLPEAMHLRGEARVDVWAYAADKSQYFAYLFYLDPETGKANWVGHAPFSCHVSEGCGLNPEEPSHIMLDFYWTAVDFPKGSQLLLVIDGNDPDYWRYATTPDENTVIIAPDYPATLTIPAVATPSKFDDPVPPADMSRTLNGLGGDGLHNSGGAINPLLLLPLLLSLFRRRFH